MWVKPACDNEKNSEQRWPLTSPAISSTGLRVITAQWFTHSAHKTKIRIKKKQKVKKKKKCAPKRFGASTQGKSPGLW